MAIYKTIIKRGKKPIEQERLKPNGIYAVCQELPMELIPEWGVEESLVWGIAQLDAQKRIRRSYNVVAPGLWCADREIDMSRIKFFKALPMEREYAETSEDARRQSSLYSGERQRNLLLTRRIEHFETSRLHRLAEWLHTLMRL